MINKKNVYYMDIVSGAGPYFEKDTLALMSCRPSTLFTKEPNICLLLMEQQPIHNIAIVPFFHFPVLKETHHESHATGRRDDWHLTPAFDSLHEAMR